MLGLPRPHVLGHLELMWAVGYASGEPVLGDELDVELAAEWTGERGDLVRALSDPAVRLLDRCDDGRYAIHDLHDHAPRYVKDRWHKEQQRKDLQRQQTCGGHAADMRRTRAEKSATPTPAPAPAPTPKEQQSVGVEPDGSTPPDVAGLKALWNTGTSAPIPQCRELTDKRKRAAAARLKERPLEEWVPIIARINASKFCRGETDRGSWVATFDWLLKPDTAVMVLEGKYDTRERAPARVPDADRTLAYIYGHSDTL
jgi:hypothetical protein